MGVDQAHSDACLLVNKIGPPPNVNCQAQKSIRGGSSEGQQDLNRGKLQQNTEVSKSHPSCKAYVERRHWRLGQRFLQIDAKSPLHSAMVGSRPSVITVLTDDKGVSPRTSPDVAHASYLLRPSKIRHVCRLTGTSFKVRTGHSN